ncbi:MAG: hypothetical protein JWM04_2841, partial [Verrucomicrobiales bacterium]|nr:hypothetical protein [Verrucomicrobiales bacterium]
LQNFTTGSGGSETTGILLASDGLLYGTKYDGGANGSGFLYRLSTAGTGFTTLHDFTTPGGGDGAYPQAQLATDGNGTFYGTTINGGNSDEGTVYTVKEDGSGYAVLHHFSSSNSQGFYPYAGLLRADDGLLYGTLQYGGSGSGGTVFKMNPNGSGFAIIHEFSGGTVDGNNPITGLVQGPDGALYGTTPSGGLHSQGIVYRLTRDGTSFSLQHSFAGGSADGSNPQSKLTVGKDGVLYGTTREGGSGFAGTVYKINPNGTGFLLLHSFLGNQDGAFPQSEVLQASDNNLYGTTINGGPADAGAIYKLSTSGSGYSVVYQFTGNNGDGRQPQGGLIQATNGVLYGSTTYGGTTADGGTLYKINTDGTLYTQLYQFSGTGTDGGNVVSTLTKGTTDNLFGTSQTGGQMGFGNVFKLFTPVVKIVGIKKDVSGWILDFTGGIPGVQYNIQASSNVADPLSWQSVGLRMPAPDGTFQVTDGSTAGVPMRFYRTSTTLP